MYEYSHKQESLILLLYSVHDYLLVEGNLITSLENNKMKVANFMAISMLIVNSNMHD